MDLMPIRLSAFASADAVPEWVKRNLASELPEFLIYPAGVELQRQACAVVSVHLIEVGIIKLVHVDAAGREVIAGFHPRGYMLGAAEALLGECSPATAVTMVPTSTRRIPTRMFTNLSASNPVFAACVSQVLARNAHVEIIQAIRLASSPALERLRDFLSDLIPQPFPNEVVGPIRFRLPPKHCELAQFLAVTPAYLSSLFRQLEGAGLIESKKGWIIIPDCQLWLQPGNPTR
jgi:CRP-like cAMP-binding protein